ncbi:protein numb isoform X5 [Octopus sinensis]|uniref:Protein numb isoform X5 n=1 Tax=Octopus sinensis TaxID=2607531 RepID=A0A6P7THH7_9MOLL|nr:protein numb isoform X5 [Octopus sinensis]
MEDETVFSNNITALLYFMDGLRWTSQMKMEKLKRSLSFRKKKDHVPECSKPHQWLEDERKVREGTCSFQVKYLGCIEVYESRGMQVCEEAVKSLKYQCKGKYQRAILYVSGDALRVVDEISKSMIVDQTIEKVSFCAPDRNHDKGFAYICRDGTTRRWICHGFMAIKESIARFFRLKTQGRHGKNDGCIVKGERLSHAVGCAFAICLERKQKRDKESGVNVTYNQDRTIFTRTGSFRQASITERIADPQSAILAGNTLNEPIPVKKVDNPYAVQRPHATHSLLQRQGSFRGFEKLHETSSPFKRSVSLRLNELPSTLRRQNAVLESPPNAGVSSPIPELSPSDENPDSVAQMCQQLSMGLRALSTDDPFASVPHSTLQSLHCPSSGVINTGASFQQSPTHIFSNPGNQSANASSQVNPHKGSDLKAADVTNPWATTNNWSAPSSSAPSSASTNPFLANPAVNGVPFANDRLPTGAAHLSRAPQLTHLRSHSIDTCELLTNGRQANRKPTLHELANQQRSFQHSNNNNNNNNNNNGWGPSVDAASNKTLRAAVGVGGSGGSGGGAPTTQMPPSSSKATAAAAAAPTATSVSSSSNSNSSSRLTALSSSNRSSHNSSPHIDPFDVAWAAKAASLQANNPFQGPHQLSAQADKEKTFQVQL